MWVLGALASTKPFSLTDGSGTVKSDVKFLRLSVERCMLICATVL